MSAGAPLIHARGLIKQFGSLTAVDGVDFDVERGEAFGFLGPNGAGKSSTMRMIGCVSPPTAGTLRILDLDPVADGPQIRGRLGVVPQQDTLDNELTVRENLIIYGRYFGLSRSEVRERADRLLAFVQLDERASSEAEQLCDRLVVMDRGRIAEEGSPLELIQRLSTREVVELRFLDRVPDVDPHVFDGRVARIEVLPDRLLLYTDDGDALVPVAHDRLQPQS